MESLERYIRENQPHDLTYREAVEMHVNVVLDWLIEHGKLNDYYYAEVDPDTGLITLDIATTRKARP